MADVTENGLRAAIKSLSDVVSPCVDKTDPLANEQLGLVVEYLDFIHQRLDHLYERDRFELRHHLAMANSLMKVDAPCSRGIIDGLTAAVQAGTQAFQSAGVPPPALKTATASIAAAIRDLVREAARFDEGARRRVEMCVLDDTQERIDFERSWYLPLAFDPSPGEVPPIENVIARLVHS